MYRGRQGDSRSRHRAIYVDALILERGAAATGRDGGRAPTPPADAQRGVDGPACGPKRGLCHSNRPHNMWKGAGSVPSAFCCSRFVSKVSYSLLINCQRTPATFETAAILLARLLFRSS
ncbi:hypothetical protein EVAR_51760_1 [Eumeta japonica]|uniref:Uncharacterized protein n=1 Tax=Eumeta variegata TaxID=151549 RepID=A0A4C1XFL6_EUMVA|nr:hypothetical protein EVAR_51760_1 [Eumeta japonica]